MFIFCFIGPTNPLTRKAPVTIAFLENNIKIKQVCHMNFFFEFQAMTTRITIFCGNLFTLKELG